MDADIEWGPYDGYISQVAHGWEVAAHGVIIDVVPDEETARTLLAEHCASRPRWRVTVDGETELIAAP